MNIVKIVSARLMIDLFDSFVPMLGVYLTIFAIANNLSAEAK